MKRMRRSPAFVRGGSLLLLSSAIGLLGTGFSSFVIRSGPSEADPVLLDVGLLISADHFIEFQEPLGFSFCAAGIVSSFENSLGLAADIIVARGEISIDFRVEMEGAAGEALNYEKPLALNVGLSAKDAGNPLVDPAYVLNDLAYGYDSMGFPTSREQTSTKDGTTGKWTLTTNDTGLLREEYLYFSIAFAYDFGNPGIDFENNIFAKLRDAGPLTVSLEIVHG